MHTLICIILNFTCGFKCIFKPILNEITGGSYTQPPHGLGYHNSVCFWTMFENCVETCLFCRSKVRSPTVSNRFPLDTFRHSKKNGVARKCLFQKKCGLDKFWPDHVSDRFRPFPTVSDRFRLFPTVSDRFIFFERLIGPIPFMEGWSSANPCEPWRLSFLVPPLCAYTAPNIASWPWYPIFPKNHKIPGAREI